MTMAERNFICNRKIKMKNSAKVGIYIFCLLTGLVFPWFNSTLWEKITFGCLLWIDMFVVMLYATQERMKKQRQRDGFYGWQMYFLSWLFLYCLYRIAFASYHWFLWACIGYGVLQTVLWLSAVFWNVRHDKYYSVTPKKPTINIFSYISVCIGIAFIVFGCLIYIKIDSVLALLLSVWIIAHYFFLVSITIIYQWCLMVRYNISDSSQISDNDIDGCEQNDEQ